MTAHDGNFSDLLTDLSLVGHRAKKPKILLNIRSTGTARPVKPSHYDSLVGILSKALDARLARKLTRAQYKAVSIRAKNAIRRLPL